MTNDEKINLIGKKILILSNNLEKYKEELDQLNSELQMLKKGAMPYESVKFASEEKKVDVLREIPEITEEPAKEVKVASQATSSETKAQSTVNQKAPSLSFEEKVGARWFSIIGIITLVIGIAIGVKYAIDNDLINEVTRLVLGYASGTIILVLALFYKKKYEAFSAVLLSGAMAVMYFTTYVGYSYYHFYNAASAFGVMALFTGFTVYAAYVYNYEVVALIALIGGYSLPMLLSTGSGEIQYMFGFMLILNCGILALSFVKYWKFVNHVAYALTWLIFVVWMTTSYKADVYLGRTLFFSTFFYLIFYLSFISYKIFRNKTFSAWDIILVLSNSLIYLGIGYNALDHAPYRQFLGLFCVANAIIHLGFALLCRKKELSDQKIFYFIIALVIGFITMAIPVQLEGNFVTLVWISEMAVLLFMSKRFSVATYKNMAYVISLLAFFSLLDDWGRYHNLATNPDIAPLLGPILNRHFLTSVFATIGFGLAVYFNRGLNTDRISKVANVALVIMSIVVCYCTFANEITLFFDLKYTLSETKHVGDYGYDWTDYDHSWRTYSALWMLVYSMAFVSVLGYLNRKKFQNTWLSYSLWALSLIIFFLDFVVGFTILTDLKESAIQNDPYEIVTAWNYRFRYVFTAFVSLFLVFFYFYRRNPMLSKLKIANTWLFHVFVLTVLSSELSNVMTMTHLDSYEHYRKLSFRMGYTVLWGLYSMALIAYGIIRKQKMLRIIAICLFAVTLIKLSVDALSMSRGYQLIVFMSIGVILLVVSFMYQKFKPVLFADELKENSLPVSPQNNI